MISNAEIMELRREIVALHKVCEEQAETLRGWLADDRLVDAERYRWLRDQHWTFDTLVVTTPDNVVIHSLCPSLGSLDVTIDAAIKAAS